MLRIVLILLGILGVVSLMIGSAFGTFLWKFTPHIPEVSYAEPADRTEARLQDLDYLRRMPEVDKSFSEEELAAFYALIDDLAARAAAQLALPVAAKASALPQRRLEDRHGGLLLQHRVSGAKVPRRLRGGRA